jgi:uncharacterized phage protein gp47/JayE
MAIPSVDNSAYPTPEEILNQYLSDVRYGYERIGVVANVSKGSEPYIRGQALANRISIAIQNNKLALADVSPLDATGDALVELAGVFGVSKRPASSASGNVKVEVIGTGAVTIPASFTCTSASGIQYQTTGSFTVSDGGSVEVQAVSAGIDTEQVSGAVLTWDSAAIGALGQNCTVDLGGIDGGSDEDTEEVLRRRLIQRLSFPEVGGNTAQVVSFAEESTSAAQAAFVYAAVRGPASYDVAVTSTSADRSLSAANLSIVTNNILANMPGSADLNVTSVDAEQLDVVLNCALPLPVNAGGAGGGWKDAVPWPSSKDGALYAQVIAKPPGFPNVITVNSTALDPPLVGQRFAIWDYVNSKMLLFTVLSVAGIPGAWEITRTNDSDPFTSVEVGSYCSADCVNLSTYATQFTDSIALLGPGQKTVSPDILPRAKRQPGPDFTFPTDLTNATLNNVLSQNDEMLDLAYAARYETGTTTTRLSPSIPLTTADPPKVLTMKYFAIRAQV